MPENPTYNLWKSFSKDGLYVKSYSDFYSDYSSLKAVDFLYNNLRERGVYVEGQDLETFRKQNFPHLAKEEKPSEIYSQGYVAPAVSTDIKPGVALPIDMEKKEIRPLSIKEFSELAKSKDPTKKEEFVFDVDQDVKKWYREKGGLTPYEKLDSFQLDLKNFYRRLAELPEVSRPADIRKAHNETIKSLSDKWGLVTEGDSVFVSRGEKELYAKKTAEKAGERFRKLAKEAREPYVRDMFDHLCMGSAKVLNTTKDFMALSEKLVNIARKNDQDYFQTSSKIARDDLDKAREANRRYDRTIVEAVRSGNMGEAIGNLGLKMAEQIPRLAVLASGNAAGATGATLGFMGLEKGGEEYLRMDENPNLSEFTKTISATTKALNEIVLERLGSVVILDNVRRAMGKAGRDVVRDAIRDSYKTGLQKAWHTVSGGVSGMSREGLEEGFTELADMTVDWAAGLPVGSFDEVLDATIVGGAMGLAMSSPVLARTIAEKGDKKNRYAKSIVNAIPKEYSPQAKSEIAPLMIVADFLEQKIAAAPPVVKKVAKGELDRVYNQIKEIDARERGEEISAEPEATYRIGDKTFEDSNEFLKEVRKLEGEEATPEITVENDDGTAGLVNEILGREKEVVQEPLPSYRVGEETFENRGKFLDRVRELKGKKTTPEINIKNDTEAENIVNEILGKGDIQKARTKEGGEFDITSPREMSTEEKGALKKEGADMFKVEAREGDETIGEFSFEREGDKIIAYHSSVKSNRGRQGIAQEVYKQMAGRARREGKSFASSPKGKRTTAAENLWKSLVRQGLAEKTGTGYEFKKEVAYDSETQGRVPRVERKGETPGRAVQEQEEGNGKTKAGRVLQAQEKVSEEAGEEYHALSSRVESISKVVRTRPGRRTADEIKLDEVQNWLNGQMQEKVRQAKDEKQAKKIRNNYAEKARKMRKIFAGEKAVRDRGALEVKKSILHDFIQDNRDALQKVHGDAVNVMLNKVNNIKVEQRQGARNTLLEAMDYMEKVMQSADKREANNIIRKIRKEVGAKKILQRGKRPRAKQSYLNKITDEFIERSKRVASYINDKNPDAHTEIVERLQEDRALLEENGNVPRELERMGIDNFNDAYDYLSQEIEEHEFGRVWDMDSKGARKALDDIKAFNKTGRTEAMRSRRKKKVEASRKLSFIKKILGETKERPGSSRIRERTVAEQEMFLWDADYAAILNQFEKNVGKKFHWTWDAALHEDVEGLEINRSELGKHKETYEAIEDDVVRLREALKKEVAGHPFEEEMLKDIENLSKENVVDFYDTWAPDLAREGERSKAFGEFAKNVEDKYNKIYRETRAWFKPTSFTGPLQKMLHTRGVRRSEEAYAHDWYDRIRKLDDKLMEFFGGKRTGFKDAIKWKNDLERELNRLSQPRETPIEYTDHNGNARKEVMTQFQALHKWLEWKMGDRETNFTTPMEMMEDRDIIGGMGWTEDSFSQLEDFLDPRVKKFGEWLVSEYKDVIDDIQPVYKRMYGTALDLIDNYVPSFVVNNKYFGDFSSILEKHDFMRGVSSDRFKRRTKNHLPLAYMDAVDVYKGYVTDMLRFKHYAESINDLERVFFDGGLRGRIKYLYGDSYLGAIQNYLDRWSGRSVRHQARIADRLMNNVSKGVLFAKALIGYKQTISTMHYGAFMPMHKFLPGLLNMTVPGALNRELVGFPGKADGLLDNQPYFADRMGAIRGLDYMIDIDSNVYNYRAGKFNDFTRALKFNAKQFATFLPKDQFKQVFEMFLKYGDRFPAVFGGGAYLKYAYEHFSDGKKLTADIVRKYKEGESNEALDRSLEQWSVISEATQQSTRTSKVSPIRANTWYGRMLTQFTTGIAQLHRGSMSAARNIARGQNVAGNLKLFTSSWILSNAMYALAENGFRFDWDEDKKEFIWKLAVGNTKGLAVVGRLPQVVMDFSNEKPWAHNMAAALQASPFGDQLGRLLYEGYMLYDKWDEMDSGQLDDRITRFAIAAATLRGIPLDGVIDIYRITEKAREGELLPMEAVGLRKPEDYTKVRRIKRK